MAVLRTRSARAFAPGPPGCESRALAALVRHIAPERQEKVARRALADAKAFCETNSAFEGLIGASVQRGEVLAALVGCVPATLKVEILLALIATVGDATRKAALSAVEASALSTFELGGQAAILDMYLAIKDVCRWYP